MTFGTSSALEHELCDGCFSGCKSPRRVTFGTSSALERIGVWCFQGTRVEDVSVPTVSMSCVMAASAGARVCGV